MDYDLGGSHIIQSMLIDPCVAYRSRIKMMAIFLGIVGITLAIPFLVQGHPEDVTFSKYTNLAQTYFTLQCVFTQE